MQKKWLFYAFSLTCLIFLITLNLLGQGIEMDSARKLNSGAIADPAIIYQKSLYPYFSLDHPVDFGMTKDKWCAVIVKIAPGDTKGQEVLYVDNTSLDSILIYSFTSAASPNLIYTGGNNVKYDRGRKWVWHSINIYREKQPVYYLILTKALAQNINMLIRVKEYEYLHKLVSRYERAVFSYLVCAGLILLSSCIGFLVVRKRVIIFYVGYLLSTASWILAHYGYASLVVYSDWSVVNFVVKPVGSLIACYCLIGLILILIPKRTIRPVIRSLLQALQEMSILVVAFALCRLQWDFSLAILLLLNVAWHVVLIGTILVIMMILMVLRSKNLLLTVSRLGFGVILTMAIIQMLGNFGFIHSPFINEHGLLISQWLEMLLLAFIIVFQLFNEQRELLIRQRYLLGRQRSLLQEQREKDLVLTSMEAQQRQTLQMLIHLQDNERKRISQDLHDSIGPLLAAIKINFHRLTGLRTEEEMHSIFGQTDQILDESIAEIRAIAHRLMPKGLSSKGLLSLLSEYFLGLEQLHQVVIFFEHRLEVSLPEDTQLNVYRMISELVLNAAKHSEATEIKVGIISSIKLCEITICDNGKGFMLKEDSSHVFGLASMQRRVAYLNGQFQIDSAVQAGTNISICIPLFIPD